MKLILIDKDRTYFAKQHFYYLYNEYKEGEFGKVENISMWKVRGSKETVMMTYKESRLADILRYEKIHIGELTTQNIENKVLPWLKKHLGKYGHLDSDGFMHDDIYIAKGSECVFISPKFKYRWLYNYECLNMAEISSSELHYNTKLPAKERISKAYNAISVGMGAKYSYYAILDSKTEKITYYKEEVNYGS